MTEYASYVALITVLLALAKKTSIMVVMSHRISLSPRALGQLLLDV